MKSPRRTGAALAAAAVVVASLIGVIWRIHYSRRPVDTSAVYTGYLTAAAVAITLLLALGGWWAGGRRRVQAATGAPAAHCRLPAQRHFSMSGFVRTSGTRQGNRRSLRLAACR